MSAWALIAGGSEGIGLAIAAALIKNGEGVVIGSRSETKLALALAYLEERRSHPDQIIAAEPFDVANYTSVENQFERIRERYGTPYYLINCAGFAEPGYLENLAVHQIRGMIETNYLGTVHTIKALLPFFQKERRGHIVNVSSMAGFLGLFGYTGYCGSKYAVIGFSDALRHELKPYGIRVSVLCPPNTKTPGFERENRSKPPEVLAMEEKVRTHSAEEVAQTLLKELPKAHFLIIPGWDSKLAYLINRWFPGFMTRFFLKRAS